MSKRDLPDDILIAIGHLITRWSTVEAMLSIYVARVVAMEHHFAANELRFNPQTFLFASSLTLGSNAKATLGQLENLIPTHATQIHKIQASLLKLKEKRDRIAHTMPGRRDGFAAFHGVSGARRKFGQTYGHTADEIHGWGDKMAERLNELTDIVNEFTSMTLQQASEVADKWAADHQAEAQRFLALLNRPDSDPPATQEG